MYKRQGYSTLAAPKFSDKGTLKTFDYVVANPPFSDKRWSTGLDPLHDPYDRFKPFGTPPGKQGDYAYLLHIVCLLYTSHIALDAQGVKDEDAEDYHDCEHHQCQSWKSGN